MFYYEIANASQIHDYEHDDDYDAEKCTTINLSKEYEWIQMIRMDPTLKEYEWIQMIREWAKMILQPLKTALKGAEFCFDYPDYDSMLLTRLTHFGKEILPICDNCRSYRFKIYGQWPDSSEDKLISTILQFGQIDCCSNVLFEFYTFDYGHIELPVDVIANWLNRSRNSNAINAKGQMENERILSIKIDNIGNISEMLDCLKKVKFNHLINLIT